MTRREYYDLLLRTSTEGLFPGTAQLPHCDRPRCRYRTPDGRRCAIGVLIPPQNYRPEAESLPPGPALACCGVSPPDGLTAADLECVQLAHDSVAGLPSWDHAAFQAALERLSCFREFAGASQEATP